MPFIKIGGKYVFHQGKLEARDAFKAGFMKFRFSPDGVISQVYTGTTPLALPPKLYGGVEERAQRIFSAWESRNRTTAILLSGVKGSGKTTLIKMLGNMAVDMGLPVWSLDTAEGIRSVIDILRSNDTKGVVIIEEMDKLFSDLRDQRHLLGLFDGADRTNLLIVASLNSIAMLGGEFHNRPGRGYYLFRYGSLPREIIHEVVSDSLRDTTQVEETVAFISTFPLVTFDIISAIVHEMNTFSVTAREAVKHMNVVTSEKGSYNHSRSFSELAYGYQHHQHEPEKHQVEIVVRQASSSLVVSTAPKDAHSSEPDHPNLFSNHIGEPRS